MGGLQFCIITTEPEACSLDGIGVYLPFVDGDTNLGATHCLARDFGHPVGEGLPGSGRVVAVLIMFDLSILPTNFEVIFISED